MHSMAHRPVSSPAVATSSSHIHAHLLVAVPPRDASGVLHICPCWWPGLDNRVHCMVILV